MSEQTCGSCISRRLLLGGAATAALAAAAAPAAQAAAVIPASTDLGAATSVPVGGGRIVNVKGTSVVVTQPKKGTYRAFSATCTHQGCTVTRVTKNRISCPCHGAEFDATTGRPVAGPARAPLRAVTVRVVKGRLVTTAALAAAAGTSNPSSPASASATPSSQSTSSTSVPNGFRLLTGTLPDVGGVAVMTAGSSLVLVHRTSSGISTWDAACPHAGQTRQWSARLVNNRIVCQAHYNSFDPATGNGPDGMRLVAIRNVRVGDGWAVEA